MWCARKFLRRFFSAHPSFCARVPSLAVITAMPKLVRAESVLNTKEDGSEPKVRAAPHAHVVLRRRTFPDFSAFWATSSTAHADFL